MRSTIRLAVPALLLALLAACGRGNAAPPAAPPDAVLRVGDHAFSKADLELRRRVVLLKYPDAPNARAGACAQLIQGSLLVEVLRAMGRPISPEDLDRELARIDRDTKDPDGLRRLKELCGPAYARIAILPDFANRRFVFDVYPNDEALHRERLEEARRVLKELRAGGAPPRDGLWQRTESPFSPDRGFGEGEADPRAREYERDLFEPTPEGEWVNRVVAQPEGFALMRWTGWDDRAARVRRVERLRLPKRDAHEHFWEAAAKVPVRIDDADLRNELERQVSWAGRLAWAKP